MITRLRQFDFNFRAVSAWSITLNQILGEVNRLFVKVSIVRHDSVQQPAFQRLVSADRGARKNHIGRKLQTRESRQALGAARSRKQTQLDLGQPHFCRPAREAIIAGHRQFEPTTHCHAIDCGYRQFGTIFDCVIQIVQRG